MPKLVLQGRLVQSMCLLFPLLQVLPGCVTTHDSKAQFSRGQVYAVSCSLNDPLSHVYFDGLTCTTENKTSDWIEVQARSVTVENGDPRFTVLSPEETAEYVESVEFSQEKKNATNQILFSGLVVAAAVAAGSSSDSDAAASFAAGVAIGTAGATSQAGETTYTYGENHILGKPMRIPPAMHLKRNFIIQRKSQDDFYRQVRICFSSPESECIDLQVGHLRNHYRFRNPS